jgi:predicted DNA repair protein MutK
VIIALGSVEGNLFRLQIMVVTFYGLATVGVYGIAIVRMDDLGIRLTAQKAKPQIR